jgi:hypothetical protein
VSAKALGKRRGRDEPEGEETAVEGGEATLKKRDESPKKRARRQLIEAARRSASPTKGPRTPSPTKGGSVFKTPVLPASVFKTIPPPAGPADPHTPSPGHQGTQPDMSQTPVIGSDYFANGPSFASSTVERRRRNLSDTEGLPFPFFATTPMPPAEPSSPTLDVPPSASRGRAAPQYPPMLTPGRRPTESTPRRPSEPTPRAVSQAHMELSTITEASPEGLAVGRGVDSGTSPVHLVFPPVESISLATELLGPALAKTGSTSPPRLSPSPSITESKLQSTTGFPSRRTVSSATTASAATDRSSPAREFMDVALHGLPDQGDSPSGQGTPNHRTMLGTERYRDTRFGDIPVVSWGTPSVDHGFGNTPRQQARREE